VPASFKTLGYITGIACPFRVRSSPHPGVEASGGAPYRVVYVRGAFSAIARGLERGSVRVPLWLSHCSVEIGEVETLVEANHGLLFAARAYGCAVARSWLREGRRMGVSVATESDASCLRNIKGDAVAVCREVTELREVSLLPRGTRPAFSGARAEFRFSRSGDC
jgi:hypothetical protein